METASAIELNLNEQGYNVFQMNEIDIVAAQSMYDAITWYEQEESCRIGPNLNILDIEKQIQYMENPNSNIQSITYRELIQKAINEHVPFPCIIATYEW